MVGGPAGGRLWVWQTEGELRLAIGQINLCIPDLGSRMTARNRPWLAKVTRQRMDTEKNCMIEDVLIYTLDRETTKWYVHEEEDKNYFEKMWKSLPPALQLFAILEAQALFGELSWFGAKGAMEAAEHEGCLVKRQLRSTLNTWRRKQRITSVTFAPTQR